MNGAAPGRDHETRILPGAFLRLDNSGGFVAVSFFYRMNIYTHIYNDI